MLTLDPNKISNAIENLRASTRGLEDAARTRLESAMALTGSDHFDYQQEQSRAHAAGKLTPAEALVIYGALGEVGCADNGGWAKDTDLATKVIVTQVVGELLKARMGIRA